MSSYEYSTKQDSKDLRPAFLSLSNHNSFPYSPPDPYYSRLSGGEQFDPLVKDNSCSSHR
ncbi:Hypothetical protein FKW44_020218, partial [Caligus rogercresseyi]